MNGRGELGLASQCVFTPPSYPPSHSRSEIFPFPIGAQRAREIQFVGSRAQMGQPPTSPPAPWLLAAVVRVTAFSQDSLGLSLLFWCKY